MNYHDYLEMMAGIDGRKRPATREELAKVGIEVRDYRRDVEGEQWNGTLYMIGGEPVKFSFYIWKAELDDVVKHISDDLWYPVTFREVCHFGNGHFSAGLVRKKCRYDDCVEQNQVAEEDEQITCPICRKELGLPVL